MDYYKHETTIIDQPCNIGKGTKIWHFSHIMPHVTIGKNCILGQNVFVGNEVIIGNHVKIQNNVSVYKGVLIEDDVFLGPSMVFTNVINPRSRVERKNEFKNTYVKRGASIGANATILCGISIGKYAMIGAGAVVTKDIKNYALVVGNPAKQIGWISEMGCKLFFDNNNIAICEFSKEKYLLKNNTVVKDKLPPLE